MQRGTRFAFAVEHRPVDWRPAPVVRQQRAVQVERAVVCGCKQWRLQDLPVVEREQEIRRERTDAGGEIRGVGVVGREQRDAAFLGGAATSRTRSSRRDCRRA
jgi:hypothetical protein